MTIDIKPTKTDKEGKTTREVEITIQQMKCDLCQKPIGEKLHEDFEHYIFKVAESPKDFPHDEKVNLCMACSILVEDYGVKDEED